MVQKQNTIINFKRVVRPGSFRTSENATTKHHGEDHTQGVKQIDKKQAVLLADPTQEGTPNFEEAIQAMRKVQRKILNNRLKGNGPE